MCLKLFPSEAIHQRDWLYNNLVIVQTITKLLYSKVLKPIFVGVKVNTAAFIRHLQFKALLKH